MGQFWAKITRLRVRRRIGKIIFVKSKLFKRQLKVVQTYRQTDRQSLEIIRFAGFTFLL